MDVYDTLSAAIHSSMSETEPSEDARAVKVRQSIVAAGFQKEALKLAEIISGHDKAAATAAHKK